MERLEQGGTPTSGYITTANSSSYAGASIGVLVNSAITAGTGITLKGASLTGWYSVTLQAAIASATGSISITGTGINYAVHSNSAGTILAAAGAVTITGTATTGQAVQLAGAITAHTGITIDANGTSTSTIATVGALTLGYGYYAGDNSNPTVISTASGASGSLMGALVGSTLPSISSGSLTGTSVPGTYSITAASLQSSTATTATYVIGFWNGTHTKMVQLVLTASDNNIYVRETAAKFNTTALSTGTAANTLGGTTNLLSLWNGSGAGGVGSVSTMTLAASSSAAGYAAANLTLSGGDYIQNTPSGNITITANNTSGGGNTGITQSGAIINNAPGSNITFTSNNLINQTGAITLAANTSGTDSTVSYDTTRGTNTSTITGGNLTITLGSTSAINYVQKSAGTNLDPGVIDVPGSITLNNTYGCSGTNCTPASEYIVASNITLAPNGVPGATINNALTATGDISINAVSNGNHSIYGIAAVTSTAGNINLVGRATNYGVYTNSAGLITASAGDVSITGNSTTGQAVNLGALVTGDSITIVGNGTAASTIVTLSTLTINAGGSDLAVTANNTSGGGYTGITQSGVITANASGGNITFTSNNLINQTGAITMAANTGGNAATVMYDTTRGTNASMITGGNLSVTSGSTSAINYVQKSSGANLDPGAINVPGTITLDNTFGCSGASCTPASGYIVASNIASGPSGVAGVTINNALTATGNIVVNGVSNGNYSIYAVAAMTSTDGDIIWTGIATNYGIYTNSSGIITAASGAVSITGTSTTGQAVNLGAEVTPHTGITIIGTGTSAGTIATVNALTLGYGYYSGDATNPSMISTATGASGSLMGDLIGSTLPTIASADLTGGSIGTPRSATAAILQSSTSTTATYLIGFWDGTYTKMVQVVLTLSDGKIYARESLAGYKATQLASGGDANVFGGTTNLASIWSGRVNQTVAATSSAIGYGAANLSLNGSGYSLNAPSGNISVTANNTAGGGNTGISQTGVMTNNVAGSNITFASNNLINQTGSITLAANTTANTATISYNTTSGTKASNITSGALKIISGSTSDVNLLIKSAGSAINPHTIGTSPVRLQGAVTIDNTYGGVSSSSGYITTSNNSSLATSSVGVTVNNAIYSTKLISIKGISYASHGVQYTAAINSSEGGVELTGTTYNSYGVYTASSLITANYITIDARATLDATYIAYIGPMTINSGATGGDITISAIGTSAGSDNGIYQSGTISAANGSDISFISNNIIDQNGAITMAANTNAISSITYDATSGNRLSTIGAGVVTTTSGSTYAINYLVKSAGSAITVAGAAVSGYINIDNTYGSASGAKSSGYFNGTNNTTSNVTSSAGVLVSGVLTAGNDLTVKGATASSWGIQNNSYTLTSDAGDITLVGVGAHGIYQMGSLIAAAGNISASAYAKSSSWAYYAQAGSQKNYIASGDITLSARGGVNSNSAVSQIFYTAGVVINSGGDFTIQGATITSGIASANPGTAVAAGSSMSFFAVDLRSSASLAYGGITYTGYKAAGDISIAGTSNGGYGIYSNSVIQSTAGSVTISGASTSSYATYLATSGTVTGETGVAIYGLGSSGSVTTAGLIRNTGTTGGVIINAIGNASIGAVTNSGADGIRITGGNGIAAGTTTGGTITALGTVTNTNGVVALSMASPGSANSYAIEGKIGITTSNASTDNIRYSVQGGNFTTPTTYTSGNYIDYRAGTTVYTITVSLGGNYSAAYGTAYTDSTALSWLRTNATVTLSATPFGVSAAAIKSGLVWNSTIGSAGINANAVQAATTIVSANILAGTGQGVTLSGPSRTYTITAKALTITNLASTSNYDAVTTYAPLVGTAGYSVSGLVTSIGGVAVTDAVSSVTQTMKSGSVVGSGSVVSGVAQNGSFNAVPSAAVGVSLSNYSITYVGVASTVNKATLTITAADDSKVYGNTTTATDIAYSAGAASAAGGVGYSLTSGTLLGTDTLTGVTLTSAGGLAATAVGTGISIIPSSATGSGIDNYTITYANGAMAVTQRPLTVTASNQNANYGSSYSLGTSSFTARAAWLTRCRELSHTQIQRLKHSGRNH